MNGMISYDVRSITSVLSDLSRQLPVLRNVDCKTRETEIIIRVTGAVTHSTKNMTSCRHAPLEGFSVTVFVLDSILAAESKTSGFYDDVYN